MRQRVVGGERVRFTQPYLRHKRGRLLYEPYGAVAVIAPWNFPFGIPFTQTIAAVAAGNAVVVKPSELTPLSGAWVERAFEAAGAPAGLVRVVQGDAATGEQLVRSRGIAKVFFTGSTGVGRKVAVAAGERLCPVSLELGGKDAMLVFEDADLDRAVEGALWGSFSNCGQTCASIERIYVAPRSVPAVRGGARPACCAPAHRRGKRLPHRARAAHLRGAAREGGAARLRGGRGRGESRRREAGARMSAFPAGSTSRPC